MIEFKAGDKSFKAGNIKEWMAVVFGVAILYGTYSLTSTIKENGIFFKDKLVSIEKDVANLKVKVEKVEKIGNNNFAKLSEPDAVQGSTYYIEKAIFSDDEIVKAKDKNNVKKY